MHMSEMCCARLAGNARPKKSPKSCHLGTIAQFCRAISSHLRHMSTIGKKLVKQQCLPHTSLQYGERRPTSGWDPLPSLGHSCKFQRVSRLDSVTAPHPPFPQIDIIGAMVIVWRARGKISSLFCALLCATIVHSELHAHMIRPNSSLDLVLFHWAHFTVLRFVFVVVLFCVWLYIACMCSIVT